MLKSETWLYLGRVTENGIFGWHKLQVQKLKYSACIHMCVSVHAYGGLVL